MSAQRENLYKAICERLRASGAFAGGTPAVAANHLMKLLAGERLP